MSPSQRHHTDEDADMPFANGENTASENGDTGNALAENNDSGNAITEDGDTGNTPARNIDSDENKMEE